VELPSFATSVDVVDLPELLRSRPTDLACMTIDIPIRLLSGSRACDKAARKLLGQPRGTSVFAAPCRAALSATTHAPRVRSIATRRAEDSASRRLGSSPRSNRWVSIISQAIAPSTSPACVQLGTVNRLRPIEYYRPMALSEEQTKELMDLLSALSNLQSVALQDAAYIPMTKEEAEQYDDRSRRIAEVSRMLGKYKPL
jgi:hypothetical protein